MTEPDSKSSAPGLVEPEGVNSASAATDDLPPSGDVRSGGHPEYSEQMEDVPEREEIVGPPDQGAGGPGQELSVGEG